MGGNSGLQRAWKDFLRKMVHLCVDSDERGHLAASSFLGAAERDQNARSTNLMEEPDKSKLGDLYHIPV